LKRFLRGLENGFKRFFLLARDVDTDSADSGARCLPEGVSSILRVKSSGMVIAFLNFESGHALSGRALECLATRFDLLLLNI